MKVAMILAAGRGERLKPLTNQRPKAMCLVQGRPLIEHHVDKLAKAGFERIVINHAYLGNQIRRHLGNGSRWPLEICYMPEPPGGLETGGGIYNALPLLGKETFLTINADIFTDYDFNSLKLAENAMAQLLLVSNPQHNPSGDFGLTENGFLTLETKMYTVAGINCYRPEFFRACKAGRYSVAPLWKEFTRQELVRGEVYRGLWIDIGSAERLAFANASARSH